MESLEAAQDMPEDQCDLELKIDSFSSIAQEQFDNNLPLVTISVPDKLVPNFYNYVLIEYAMRLKQSVQLLKFQYSGGTSRI